MNVAQGDNVIKPSMLIKENLKELSRDIESNFFAAQVRNGEIKAPSSNRRNFRVECSGPDGLNSTVFSLPRAQFVEFFGFVWERFLKTDAQRLDIIFYEDEKRVALQNQNVEFKGVGLEARMSAFKDSE